MFYDEALDEARRVTTEAKTFETRWDQTLATKKMNDDRYKTVTIGRGAAL